MAYIGKPILAVDFDGTIRQAKRATMKEFVLMNDCKSILRELHLRGFRMILWTCRSNMWLESVIDFLTEENILQYFECINENVKDIIWWNTRKIYADCYIDDLNLQGFPGWILTYNILKNRFPDMFKEEHCE